MSFGLQIWKTNGTIILDTDSASWKYVGSVTQAIPGDNSYVYVTFSGYNASTWLVVMTNISNLTSCYKDVTNNRWRFQCGVSAGSVTLHFFRR